MQFTYFLINVILYFLIIHLTISPIPNDRIQTMVSILMSQSGNSISKSFQNYVNRSCTQEYGTTLSASPNTTMPQNEICVAISFDFSSTFRTFTCSDWICNKKGVCFYDYFSNYVTCYNCTKNSAGDFCNYALNDYNNFVSGVQDIYNNLNSRLNSKTKTYFITTTEEYISYLNFMQVLLPFYSTAFKNNNNKLFNKIDFFVQIFYDYIDPTLSPIPVSNIYSFISYLVSYSIYSFQLDYLRFIYLYLDDESAKSHSPFFGRSSILLDVKNDVSIKVGIQQNLDYSLYSLNYYYGTGGYPKFGLQSIAVKIPINLSQYLFRKYYTMGADTNFIFRMVYVASYVSNPALYFTRPGILMKTPIVNLSLQWSQKNFEFRIPEEDYYLYDYISFILPWSNPGIKFSYGNLDTNCRVMKWEETGRSWLSVFDSYIDIEKSTINYVYFYAKQFGTYAVDCENVEKIF